MLAERYGVMPWHFGGDETLTDAEAAAFIGAADATVRDDRRRAADRRRNAARTGRPRRGR